MMIHQTGAEILLTGPRMSKSEIDAVALAEQEVYDATLGSLADPKGRYVVVLASVGNIDFGQDPRRAMPGVPKTHLRVASLEAASDACRLYITYNDLGGGNWIGGQVYLASGRGSAAKGAAQAQISYNGRAWKPVTSTQSGVAP